MDFYDNSINCAVLNCGIKKKYENPKRFLC